ncbi:hypothetical protein ANCDUO_00199 [Ancylostoma duodenale]|uniref:Uncharacterized protein n=1 Tax=Ancylostoma duodenale TaxID=51022 RepID=A0A0C2DHN5_9BILA|nr:hypothetical protein ANCDUO_00199 [Ancylostoma duodenale]
MILEAVREDRMPGGRNGSVVCNLYKLRCRKVRDRAAVRDSLSACENITDDGGRLMECGDYPVSKNKNLIQVQYETPIYHNQLM